MLLNESKGLADFPPGETGVLRKLNGRLKPELGLSTLPLNVDVNPWFLPGEEVEPEAALAKYRRTHGRNDTRRLFRMFASGQTPLRLLLAGCGRHMLYG